MSSLPVAADEVEPRFLIFALDAVPYSTVAALTSDAEGSPGLLATFPPPVPLVSTFPSSTSVALSAILKPFGLDTPPGYENRFYDHEAGKVRGGTLASYGKIQFDWHYFFDWQLRGFFRKSRAYASPRKYNVKEVDRALEEFEKSDSRAFWIYVNSTDAAGHVLGPDVLTRAFENLDARLTEIRERHPEPLYVVIFSDHGMEGGEVLSNAFVDVRQALAEGGWRSGKALGKPGRIVLAPFGLVSNFEIYTNPGDEAAVTEIAVGEPGVDLCAYREGEDRWIVTNRDGSAAFERRREVDGNRWAYFPDSADPLEYLDVVARLTGEANDSGYASEQSWFDETIDEAYPDGLFRLASGFELVQNPASVLCSVANGFFFGSKLATFGENFSVGKLTWTHGALGRDATLGFLMTDYPGWTHNGAVRFDTALEFLAEALASDSN